MLRVAMLCLVLPLGLPPSPAQACGDPGRVRYEPRTFLGYACEDGCERHKAGFRWAERHLVTHPWVCALLPQAEAEGCVAYDDAEQDAEAAGSRWAVENEIVRPCQCEGAGEQFRVGCTQTVEIPADPGK
jgi:hypothetical protein